MARGRMINKKICNSRVVNDLPLPAQLLYTWLIPHLDCNGCFYGSAQMIKSLVFPRKNYTKKIIEGWLELLTKSVGNEKNPLIVRYFVDSEQYLFMPGFAGEQIGLRYDKEKPEFPTFDGKDTETIRKVSDKPSPEVEVEVEVEVEGKEENIQKKRHGEFQNVLLTSEEYGKLKDKFGAGAEGRIESLSSYMESRGKSYKSHYATILSWSRKEAHATNRNPRELPKIYTPSPDYDDL